jgi:N-methylhydantoinase B
MFLSDGHASIEGDGHRHAPWGIFCGDDGSCGALVLNPTKECRDLPAMISNLRFHRGDTLRTISPCGGGYGHGQERDPGAVLKDVLDGIISRESALKDYKVVVTDQLRLDEAATNELRRS